MRLVSPHRLIATTLAIGSIAAPAAYGTIPLNGPGLEPILRPVQPSALPAVRRAEAEQAQARSYQLPRTARYSKAEMNAYASAVKPDSVFAPVDSASSNGFDYAAAAVGAGITGGIALLITAGSLAIRRRSQPHHP